LWLWDIFDLLMAVMEITWRLLYISNENGVIHDPKMRVLAYLGEDKEALGKARQKLREIETGENAKPGNLAGLTREEETIGCHSIYQNIGHSHNVQNRTFRGRLQDHEMLLDTILVELWWRKCKILKDILLNPQTDGMFFIDIVPVLRTKILMSVVVGASLPFHFKSLLENSKVFSVLPLICQVRWIFLQEKLLRLLPAILSPLKIEMSSLQNAICISFVAMA
jgi:hypothetical protein